MCFYVSACAAIKLKLFSLSLSFSLSCASTSYQTSDAKESRCVSLFFLFSLGNSERHPNLLLFFTWCRRRVARNIWSLPGLGAGTGRLRAVRAKKKEQRVVGGENDDGRYKKIRISRAKEWKAV